MFTSNIQLKDLSKEQTNLQQIDLSKKLTPYELLHAPNEENEQYMDKRIKDMVEEYFPNPKWPIWTTPAEAYLERLRSNVPQYAREFVDLDKVIIDQWRKGQIAIIAHIRCKDEELSINGKEYNEPMWLWRWTGRQPEYIIKEFMGWDSLWVVETGQYRIKYVA